MRHLSPLLVLSFALLTALPVDAEGTPAAIRGFGCDFIVGIEFDDVVAPINFVDTMPLSTEYSNLGITFLGPGPGQGGAVLDELSGFGVSGHSSPNFLAFNDVNYAVGPETFEFFVTTDFLELKAGLGAGHSGTLSLDCFDDEGTLLGSQSIVGSPILQTMRVDHLGIASCTFAFTSQTAVIDDLVYQPCDHTLGMAEVPTLDLSRLTLFAALMLAAALYHLSRRA